MRARFAVYEIEHGGDEENALEDLMKAGASAIKVVARDYEGEEAIVVECELPESALDLKDFLDSAGVIS